MRKKYQIFVSSTYADLRDERQAAVEAILMAGHIPAGMELFAAGDEGQLDVIKRWIDDSDMYCLVLGPRYGSIEPKSGLSYTEIEYDYALSRAKPFFALVLSDSALQAKITVLDPKLFEHDDPAALANFRTKVLNKIVRPVSDSKDIKLYTLEAIRGLEGRYELDGWIRSTDVVEVAPLTKQLEILSEERRRSATRIGELENQLAKVSFRSDIAGLEDKFSTVVTYRANRIANKYDQSVKMTWGDLFGLISPKMLQPPGDASVKYLVPRLILEKAKPTLSSIEEASIPDHDFDSIKVHMMALELIEITYSKTVNNSMGLFWVLTDKGRSLMLQLRSAKKPVTALPTGG